jgi:hypothetical protein
MRTIIVALAVFLAPICVFGDHRATVITVFDDATYKEMVGTNTVKSVSERDLFSKTLLRGAYFPTKGDDVAATFEHKETKYRLLISRSDTRTIYSIAKDGTIPQVVAVGEISRGDLSKKAPVGDPFVVVIRGGNYLRK